MKQPQPSADATSSDKVAQLGLTVAATAAVTLTALTLPFLRRFTGAPYVASAVASRQAISTELRNHARSHKPQPNAKRPQFIDLGSGSGELVLDAARAGYQAHGVELNPWLVLAARWKARRNGLSHLTSFHWHDMWHVDVSHAHAVAVFGVPDIMERIGSKLQAECHTGCLVCSNTFKIPHWSIVCHRANVWFYLIHQAEAQGRILHIGKNKKKS